MKSKTEKSLDEIAHFELPSNSEFACLSILADQITPVQAFERLRHLSPYAFLLESSETDSRLARFSIIGYAPLEIVKLEKSKLTILKSSTKDDKEYFAFAETGENDNILTLLSLRLKAMKNVFEQFDCKFEIPFSSAYVGYLGYGASTAFDRIKAQETDPFLIPDGIFAFYDSLLIFDHRQRQLRILSFKGEENCRRIAALLESAPQSTKLSKLIDTNAESAFACVNSSCSKVEFIGKVERCKSLIEEGQAFQIVVSQRFTRNYKGDPFAVYRALQCINPSPYGYYLQFPDFVYLGASPERFLCQRQERLSLSALAGTRARGKNEAEDGQLEAELLASEKEMAEHYMLVDLGRNDLGRVAETGSVEHGPIAQVTYYGQVMHLSTEISARLKQGLDCFAAAQSCFPAGTVSGAPKIRAMELLAEIETERRGIYSGMVGYFDTRGNMDSAIAIRSALIKDGTVHVNAGAGIVLDSNPEEEFEETRNKALSVLKAVAIAEDL